MQTAILNINIQSCNSLSTKPSFLDCFQRNKYSVSNEHQTLKAGSKILGQEM